MDFRTAAIPPTASSAERAVANFRKLRLELPVRTDQPSSAFLSTMILPLAFLGPWPYSDAYDYPDD